MYKNSIRILLYYFIRRCGGGDDGVVCGEEGNCQNTTAIIERATARWTTVVIIDFVTNAEWKSLEPFDDVRPSCRANSLAEKPTTRIKNRNNTIDIRNNYKLIDAVI